MLIIVLSITIAYLVIHFYKEMEIRHIAKQLDDWTLYVNTSNCGFCLKQIEFLKDNTSFVNIVHCDDNKNVRECSNLQSLPQWVRGNKKIPGARLSLVSLKELLDK